MADDLPGNGQGRRAHSQSHRPIFPIETTALLPLALGLRFGLLFAFEAFDFAAFFFAPLDLDFVAIPIGSAFCAGRRQSRSTLRNATKHRGEATKANVTVRRQRASNGRGATAWL
jgi:hypothetical protein